MELLKGPTPQLETVRLLLVPRCADDNPHLQPLFNNWNIIQFMVAAVPWPYPDDGCAQHWQDIVEPKMKLGEEFCWTLRAKENPEVRMGQINLRAQGAAEEHRGFWLGVPYQKQGFMQEAADEIMRYAFEEQGYARLLIGARDDNTASNRIKEKQGFRRIKSQIKKYAGGFEHESVQWELTRDDYFARR